MTETSSVSGAYQATIPGTEVTTGTLKVRWNCGGTLVEVIVGWVQFFDPSGIITDAQTGKPIQGATITLYRVPNALPDTANQTHDCRTVSTRPGTDWSQVSTATLDLGIPANPDSGLMGGTPEISPTLNPLTTGSDGAYGWNVVTGCWYAVVQASGYEAKISPVVGVPPIVTDLNLALIPQQRRVYLPIISKN